MELVTETIAELYARQGLHDRADSLAVRAIHEFLAFQREDHRSAGHGTSH